MVATMQQVFSAAVKRVFRWWWLILAIFILLPVGDDDSWRINVLELFAVFVLLIGTVWVVLGWRKQCKRRQQGGE